MPTGPKGQERPADVIGEPMTDTRLALQALAYVHKLYAELMADHAAPGLGTQNQRKPQLHLLRRFRTTRYIGAFANTSKNLDQTGAKPFQGLKGQSRPCGGCPHAEGDCGLVSGAAGADSATGCPLEHFRIQFP